MKYDRSAITRRAHQLRREQGLSFGDAMRAAWGEAKSPRGLVAVADRRSIPVQNHCAQPRGVSAALRRYGIERRAIRVAEAVREFLAIGGRISPAKLVARYGDVAVIEARHGSDGTWRT